MVEKNKNYLPALILTFLWWVLLGGMVLLVDPEVLADFPLPRTYGLFFGFLFLAVWFSASLLLGKKRRGLWVAMGVVVLGYLKIWGLFSLLNLILVVGTLVAFEVMFDKKNGVD